MPRNTTWNAYISEDALFAVCVCAFWTVEYVSLGIQDTQLRLLLYLMQSAFGVKAPSVQCSCGTKDSCEYSRIGWIAPAY
jgi:hypothetical protein